MQTNTQDNKLIINTLFDFINELKKSTTGKSREDALNYMVSIITPYNIKCSFADESYFAKKDTNNKNNENNNKITDKSDKNILKSKYQDVSRILLTYGRNKPQSSIFAQECNGVVLEFPSWDILSLPPPVLALQCNLRKLDYTKYQVYEINDGTTITLYYYKNAWAMSTSNGIDVTNLNWMGSADYGESFLGAVAKYPDFSFDKLDKSICYTIGFRCSNFHPFMDTFTPSAWFISARNLKTLEFFTADGINIGIPAHNPIKLPYDDNIEIGHYLHDRNQSALTNLLNNRLEKDKTSKNQPLTSLIQPLRPHYGFILRSVDNSYPSYVVESTLLKQIRMLMYNQPKSKYAEQIKVDHNNRLEYMILKSYLHWEARCNFKNLFPELAAIYYNKYDAVFSKLTNKILNILRNTKQTREPYQSNKMGILTRTLVAHIEKHLRINVMDAQGYGIVHDFIMNPDYLELFFACIV